MNPYIIFVGKLETDHRGISSNGLPVTFPQDWAVVVANTLTHIDKLKKKTKKTDVSIAKNFSIELQY